MSPDLGTPRTAGSTASYRQTPPRCSTQEHTPYSNPRTRHRALTCRFGCVVEASSFPCPVSGIVLAALTGEGRLLSARLRGALRSSAGSGRLKPCSSPGSTSSFPLRAPSRPAPLLRPPPRVAVPARLLGGPAGGPGTEEEATQKEIKLAFWTFAKDSSQITASRGKSFRFFFFFLNPCYCFRGRIASPNLSPPIGCSGLAKPWTWPFLRAP